MNRIAYVLHLDFSQESGILKKIRDQVNSWRALGIEVKIFALLPNMDIWSGLDHLDIVKTLDRKGLSRFLDTALLSRKVSDWQPDVVYLRFEKSYPAFEDLARRFPTILEINTDDTAENKVLLRSLPRLYHKLTRHRLLRAASGLVNVTHELEHRMESYNVPSCVIGNGIDLSNFETVNTPPSNVDPVLIFMGSQGYAWHGIDKIFVLAELFPSWTFFIVGIDDDYYKTYPKNVRFLGRLSFKDYKKYLDQSDVAIGTLSLHLIENMNEASPLKMREYLASGLPSIIGHVDTDFISGADFILQLANSPNNVEASIDNIEQFVYKWLGSRVPRSRVAHIDTQYKERRRIDFFRQVSVDFARKNL